MGLKKNDYFLDVSSYQPANLSALNQASGTNKAIIKVSEGTGYASPNRHAQAASTGVVGYYHFARFGGSVAQAQAEARYFLSLLPTTDFPYAVCDYEDSASSSKDANTQAIIAWMDVVAQAGYRPIYYSYKPYTVANTNYHQILERYPNSLWIAAYPNYNVTPDPVWSIFPSLDGIRWWQFTSTGIAGGLDKNVVLLDDDANVQTGGGQQTTPQQQLSTGSQSVEQNILEGVVDNMGIIIHFTNREADGYGSNALYFFDTDARERVALTDMDQYNALKLINPGLNVIECSDKWPMDIRICQVYPEMLAKPIRFAQ